MKLKGRVLVQAGDDGEETHDDAPTDCPEYLCFYCFDRYHDGPTSQTAPSMLFNRVSLDEEDNNDEPHSSFQAGLKVAREKHPATFRRSLCFVLSVKRNKRWLMAYNFNPQVLKRYVNLNRKGHLVPE